MLVSRDVSEYRSPVKKLVRFFASSRDGWKAKCAEAKQRCKRLANQVRAVEKSRQQWRELAEEREQRIAELERETAALKRATA
jgi:muramoyltetrapeptide carboxypeptidase LdcA involved in peptidoglycan recycling